MQTALQQRLGVGACGRRALVPVAALQQPGQHQGPSALRPRVGRNIKAAAAQDGEAALPRQLSQTGGEVARNLNARAAAEVVTSLVEDAIKAPYIWYSTCLTTRPLLTKAVTAFAGFMLGDVLAQHMTHAGHLDVLRTIRLGSYGLFIDGPVGSIWYDVLEQRVCPDSPTSTKAVLLKTFLDQTVYATIMTAVYFTVIRLLEGHPDAIQATLAAKFWPTLAANYMVWPVAHLINFRYVPSDFRILYNNVICIAWLTVVSLMTHTNIGQLLHCLHK